MTFPVITTFPQNALTAQLTATASNVTDTSIYTFAGLSIGTASGNSWLLVSPYARGTGTLHTVSSITVNSVTATHVVNGTSNTGAVSQQVGFWALPMGGSTTQADIVMTLTGSVLRGGVAVYRMIPRVTSPLLPRATAVVDSAAAFTSIYSLSGGLIIAALGMLGTNVNATWSGLSEVYDFQVEVAATGMSGALSSTSIQSTKTVTAVVATGLTSILVMAAWE